MEPFERYGIFLVVKALYILCLKEEVGEFSAWNVIDLEGAILATNSMSWSKAEMF